MGKSHSLVARAAIRSYEIAHGNEIDRDRVVVGLLKAA